MSKMDTSNEIRHLISRGSSPPDQVEPSGPKTFRFWNKSNEKGSASPATQVSKQFPEFKLIKIGDEEIKPAQSVEIEREKWGSFSEYFLSIIGFVIDLGNVWRFPTVCYMNGGGAFLLPFLICLFAIGMPCMYMELAAGQYFQSGNITIWAKMSPYMKGIGYTVLIVNLLMLSYYNTLQGYAIYYLAYSFRSPVPWSTCQNKWNTDKCHVRDALANHTTDVNSTDVEIGEDAFLPSSEFFTRKVLGAHLSTGFQDLHGLKFDLLLCVFIVFVISTLCLIKGIKTSGKAVYVTALLPYLCLAVLIFQSLLLDGSIDGLKYYLTPQFDQLFKLQVWLAAAIQIFFSLGPGFGVLITYSSYSSQKTNIRRLTFMCSLVNCFTSLLYGVVVFAGLGYMAKRINKDINYFLRHGIGLVFAVYPEIISTFKGAYIYAVIFFVMLITLGLDSTFAGMEGLYTAISDEYPVFKRHSILTRIGISAIPFLTSIPTISYGGIYVVQWMDTFAISPSVLLVVFAEVITVSWLYGLNRFSANIEEMNHTKPFIIWRLSWKFLCPVVLFTIVALDIAFFQGLTYGDYTFPRWSTILGYSLNAVALTPILAYMLFYFVKLRFFSKQV